MLVAVVIHGVTGFATTPPDDLRIPPEIGHEWLVVKAAWSGIDPYQPLDRLSEAFDLPVTYRERSPRPPGAFIVEAPLSLLPFGSTAWVMAVTIAVSVTLLAALTVRALRLSPVSLPLVALGLSLISPLAQPILYLNFVFVILVAVAATVDRAALADRYAYGIPLGLAIAMRLWPAVILIPLIVGGRRRVAMTAALLAGVATAGGLTLPGVSLRGVIEGLSAAGNDWRGHEGNLSLLSFLEAAGVGWILIAVAALILIIAVVRSARSAAPSVSLALATTAGALLSPLAWGSYLAAGLPLLARIAVPSKRAVAWVAVGAVYATHWTGRWMLVVGLAVVALLVLEATGSHEDVSSDSSL